MKKFFIFLLTALMMIFLNPSITFAEKSSLPAHTRIIAQNKNLKLYYQEDSAIFGLENKKNHYIWWSSPLGAEKDEIAAPLIITELQSSAVLTYADRNAQSVTNLRSGNSAEISTQEIDNGLQITYHFEKCGITIPVSYQLEEDYLAVSVSCPEIQEIMSQNGLVASQLTLLEAFGAGSQEENGYFVIPDGCGALIRFHNGKINSKSYAQKVYGRDITTVSTTKPAVTEEIYMPLYGIVKEQNALTVLIEEGAGNATLNASVSEQSLSSYDLCYFSFQLRGSDTYTMAGDYGNLTVFEDGDIKTNQIKLRYYPVADENASYTTIAETYRNYLLKDGNVSKKAVADSSEFYLHLYGGTLKAQSVLGIPVTKQTSVTNYQEAQEIISTLENAGIDQMSVIYHNCTNSGVLGKTDYSAITSTALGGLANFNNLLDYLEEHEIAFYPAVNNKTFRSGNGYYTMLNTAVRISDVYSRQAVYDLSYGIQDASAKTKALLSPEVFTNLYRKLAFNFKNKKIHGICLGEMTSTLWGDYGKKAFSRDDTLHALQDSYQEIQDQNLSLLADSCASYAFPYADKISNVPLHSSGFDIFDEEIPFYQLVLHGVIPYSSPALNASADVIDTFLTAVSMGCQPAYDMIYRPASDLNDTDLEKYYYANYQFWTDTAVQEYQLTKEILSGVSDQLMTDYTRNQDGSVTTYEDGTQITVNYEEQTITVNDIVYQLKGASAS